MRTITGARRGKVLLALPDGRARQRINGRWTAGPRLNRHMAPFKAGVSRKQRSLEETGTGWEAQLAAWTGVDKKHGVNVSGHLGYSF